MRFVLTAMLALALGLLPIGTAHAHSHRAQPAPMSCHAMAEPAGQDMSEEHQSPRSDTLQDCANHCLSQVNGQAALAPLLQPSLVNAVRAERSGQMNMGKPLDRDPPEPPPPRS